jgi:hypothetical protein
MSAVFLEFTCLGGHRPPLQRILNHFYDGTSGRFLSPDPLGHGASMDLYSFADGDPLNNFDPDGRLFAGTLNGAGQWGSQMYAGLGNALDAALHAIVSPWNPLTATRNFSGGYEADFRYQRNLEPAHPASGNWVSRSPRHSGSIAAQAVPANGTTVIS